MEAYERVRELRKNKLHLSQTEFGERLGVSRSVINNIELNALAKPEGKLPLYRLICKEFHVSEDWLLNGEGEMFVESDEFDLNAFAEERHMSDMERELLAVYLELDEPTRRHVLEHFRERISERKAKEAAAGAEDRAERIARLISAPDISEGDLEGLSAAELEEVYKKRILKEPSPEASTASNTTGGTVSDSAASASGGALLSDLSDREAV